MYTKRLQCIARILMNIRKPIAFSHPIGMKVQISQVSLHFLLSKELQKKKKKKNMQNHLQPFKYFLQRRTPTGYVSGLDKGSIHHSLKMWCLKSFNKHVYLCSK